jgi:peptidase E
MTPSGGIGVDDAPVVPRAAEPARTVILLGPQGHRSTLAEHLASHNIDGRIATVTAGWQEREDEIHDLQTHLDGRSVNLRLHARADAIFTADPGLAALHRERQNRLQLLRRLYAIRLDFGMEAALTLARREGNAPILEQQRAAAVAAVRALDIEHRDAIRNIHAEFDERLALDEHAEIIRHREEIAQLVDDVQAIAIAGGHVAVLLNRLRLFDGPRLGNSLPIIGWSAGAMVLCDWVVLYHDSPPQGAGNAELFEEGLGLAKKVVALPHAQKRLTVNDPYRVGRFAQRFNWARCLTLDDGAAITFARGDWSASPETRQLYADGHVGEVAR